jgi:murein DD-endopeptidase MepM/ murein hydrolase activator NlpD
MPRLPQRRLLFTVSRPVGAAVAGAGLVLALTGSSTAAATRPAAHPATRVAATPPEGARPNSRPPGRRDARVARSLQRNVWVRPVPGPVTSWFGRRWGALHPGIDLGSPYGTPVHTITSGWVLSAGWISGYGKTVRVWSHGLVFYYPHLSRILHRRGFLQTGEVLGRVGSTGFSTGPHLHVEIRHHGRPFNPRAILWQHGVRLRPLRPPTESRR